MHFVNHQQAAREHGMAHVCVFELQGCQQGLVNGAYRNGRCQITLGGFSGPAAFGFLLVRLVMPEHLKARQRLVGLAVCSGVARQGAHHHRRFAFPGALYKVSDAVVELCGGHPCRQRKVQRIHSLGTPQVQEAPQCGLRFAAAGFSLQSHHWPQLAARHGLLHGTRRGDTKGLRELVMGGLLARGSVSSIQPNGTQRMPCAGLGRGCSVFPWLGVWEETGTGV